MKLLNTTFVIGAALGLGLAISGSAQAKSELRLSTVVNKPHPWIEAAEYMASEVAKRTGGEIKVNVFPGGALGKDQTAIDEMRMGTVDFVIGSTQNAAPFVPEYQIFSLSYLFKDIDSFRKVTAHNGPLFKKLSGLVEDRGLGFKLLALTGGGVRNMSNSVRPIKTPDDLKGLKMRVTAAKVEAKIWKALGTLPTSLPWTELYTAAQTGVVEGFESSISGYRGSKLYEVGPYHAKTQHQVMTSHISISTATYNRLPEKFRKVIETVAVEAADLCTKKGEEFDARFLDELQAKHGVKVNEVDKAAFMARVLPLQDEFAESNKMTDLLEMIRTGQK